MNQDEIQQLLKTIQTYANQAAGIAAPWLPPQAMIPLIIGKAIIDFIPGLEADVYNMVNGVPQTPEQQAATAQKLSVLGNPDGL